jgi:hypothetical protein
VLVLPPDSRRSLIASRGGRVRFYIDGDSRSAERASARAAKSLDKLDKTGARVGSNFAKHAKKLAAFGAGLASIATAKDAVKTTVDLGKATAALARISGIETKTASAWVEVAKTRGVQGKQLNIGFITLARNIRAANAGVDKSADLFRRLGVSQKTLESNKTGDVMNDLADAFERMPDGAQKAAIAQQLFGRQAQSLLPLLNQGSGALREQLGLAETYGATLDKNGVKKALEAAKAQRELTLAMDGLKIAFATKVLPALTAGGRGLAQFIGDVRRGKNANNDFVRSAATGFGAARQAVANALGGIRGFLRQNREEFRAVGSAARNVGAVVKFAFEQGMLPVVRRVIPAITGFMRGGLQAWRGIVRVISGVLTGDFGRAWRGVKDIFSGGIRQAVSVLRGMTAPIREIASRVGHALVQGILSPLGGLAGKIKDKVLGGLGSLPGKVGGALKGLIPGKAKGDPHFRGGLAIVGEEGPELARLPAGTRIFSNPVSKRMMRQARGAGVPGFAGGGVARTIYKVGKRMGASPKVMLAAFEAAIVESNLTNVKYGDRDSLGVFQQRPSQGWGSPAQVTNVEYAATQFFKRAIAAGGSGTAGQLAQSVQRSAFPGRYDQVRGRAQGIIAGLSRGGGGGKRGAPATQKPKAKPKKPKLSPGDPSIEGSGINARINKAQSDVDFLRSQGRDAEAELAEDALAGLLDKRAGIRQSKGKTTLARQDRVSAAEFRQRPEAISADTGGTDTSAADAQAEHLALLRELADVQKQRLATMERIATSQYGVLSKAISDVVSGQLGGRIGLGFSSPSFAGGVARY